MSGDGTEKIMRACEKLQANSEEILFDIAAEAYEIWEAAGCTYDFCVQLVAGDCIVFGAVNRVVWTVKRGFRIDKSYCTERFQQAYARWSE